MRVWLPPLAWMALIFTASTDSFSSGHTSRYIAPLLRWLFPALAEPTIDLVVLLVRKAAHPSEYAVLAVLWWRALRQPMPPDSRNGSWRAAGLALLLSALWAATDELHQSFTATRGASAWDVLLDTTGAGLGLLLLSALGTRRGWW